MGKRSRNIGEDALVKSNASETTSRALFFDDKVVDPALALLFASSSGPVQAPPKSRYEEPPPPKRRNIELELEGEREEDEEEEPESDEEDGEQLSSVDGDIEDGIPSDESEDSDEELNLDRIIEAATQPDRKRKRKADEEDLESKYLQKLAREELKEEEERQAERRLKRQRTAGKQDDKSIDEDEFARGNEDGISDVETLDSDDESQSNGRIAPAGVPLHETLAPSKDSTEIEKASRTVFLANVATAAITSKSAKKELLVHMASFFPDIAPAAEKKPEHKVESIRFRSTAYAGTALPKKAAFAKKELMESTTRSTNAYVVYSSAFVAREAVKKLNGSVVLDRHLRVDSVAHPAKTDHKRCVFVGNLGFVDDESMMDQGGENERKRSKIPSDIEEGLWRQFGKAGKVESVRVIRDEKTRVGKGFAYVQFEDANTVEEALLFNEKKYPPMLPRILRVVRAKPINKTANAQAASKSRLESRNNKVIAKDRIYNPKIDSQVSSLEGRAGKLLGKAGAARLKKRESSGANMIAIGKRGDGQKDANWGMSRGRIEGIAKTPESIVFEGYRASAKNGRPKDLKMGKKQGKGKPKTRSSNRASEWKKGGTKKK
ncbi:hypothetical protein B0O99DRAFT_546749 [Bisporella sp. PMI_857]|nr:hypothetical protein B0O99DRAFT_546749 [Bisporella sp. PMI_857]